MNSKLKTLLKITTAIVVPGGIVLLLARAFMKDVEERKEFQAYILKTYGKDSKYVDRYH